MNDQQRLRAIGVDIGGVLVDRAFHDSDTSFFGHRPMDTPHVAGCFDGLRHLTQLFDGQVHIVSKAGPRVAALSAQWLQLHGVHDYVPPSNVWFVDKRSDKAYYAAELGLTHFVDDRIDVLELLGTVTHRFWLVTDEDRGRGKVPPWARRSTSWRVLMQQISSTLAL